MVALGGHVWLLGGACMVDLGGVCGCSGACMVAPGGMRGCSGGCMVAPGGVWLFPGVCVVAPGGMHGCSRGEHAWDITRYGDTVNERAVRILLECILVQIVLM